MRPKRYPYTRDDWEEVSSEVLYCNGILYSRYKVFRNRLTGETITRYY